METQNAAAVTVAPGSVATPGSEATTQATTVTREAQASPSPTQPVSREDRRRSIADWLDKPGAAPATPQDKTASTDAGNGSPPAGQGGASDDLSQSPPTETEDAPSSDEDQGEDAEEGDTESTTTDKEKQNEPKGQWPKQAVERVRKLKDQKQQLKSQLAERESTLSRLEAENRELRGAGEKPAGGTKAPTREPLAGVTDPKVIQQKAEEATQVVNWAEDLLDVVTDDPEQVSAALEAEGLKAPEGGWSAEAMRQALRGIRSNARSLVQSAPKRLEFIQREDQSLAAAISLAPDLEDPESDLAKRVHATVANRPFVKQEPDWPILALAAVVGIQVLQERQKAGQAAKAGATATPAAPAKQVARAPKMPGAPRSNVAAAQSSEVDVVRERALRPGATREDRRAYVRATLEKSPSSTAA